MEQPQKIDQVEHFEPTLQVRRARHPERNVRLSQCLRDKLDVGRSTVEDGHVGVGATAILTALEVSHHRVLDKVLDVRSDLVTFLGTPRSDIRARDVDVMRGRDRLVLSTRHELRVGHRAREPLVPQVIGSFIHGSLRYVVHQVDHGCRTSEALRER